MTDSYLVLLSEAIEACQFPLEHSWGHEPPITIDEISDAVNQKKTSDTVWGYGRKNRAFDTRDYHIQRIAHLVRFPDSTPLLFEIAEDINTGKPTLLEDGNHRLVAAVIRGQTHIEIEYGGWVDEFESVFPSAKEK